VDSERAPLSFERGLVTEELARPDPGHGLVVVGLVGSISVSLA
jgi:hypothetical protein